MSRAASSFAVCLSVLPLVACVNDAVATRASSNPQVQVDELFTHDGCTVYRFQDGQYHYYVRCRDGEHAATLSCRGKNCKNDDSIPTATVAPR